MKILLKNELWTLRICLNVLKIFGVLVPGNHSRVKEVVLMVYWTFWFSFLVGIYIIVQFGDLVLIWGNIPLMVNTSFLLLTNMVLATKMIVINWRKKGFHQIIKDGNRELRDEVSDEGKEIIQDCNFETSVLFVTFATLTAVTVLGWAGSAEKNTLPLRAWYPYDAYKSPAYELTYAHQTIAVSIAAAINICMDNVVATLMAVCRCRLRLSGVALRNLFQGFEMSTDLLNQEQEKILSSRLRACVLRHQAALRTADDIQTCFTWPILGQLCVSLFIICISAYQLAVELHQPSLNIVHCVAMTTYLIGMVQQVFIYCYQGDQLTKESSEISYYAYQCEWYLCSPRVRQTLLLVMIRSNRATILTAGGFTSLSLTTFTSLIKASYTFFTVLQQVEDRRH